MQKSKKFIETQSLYRRVRATHHYKDHGKMFSTQPYKAVFRSRTTSQEPTKKSGHCLLAIKYDAHANYYFLKYI